MWNYPPIIARDEVINGCKLLIECCIWSTCASFKISWKLTHISPQEYDHFIEAIATTISSFENYCYNQNITKFKSYN